MKMIILNGWAAPTSIWNKLQDQLNQEYDIYILEWRASDQLLKQIVTIAESEPFILIGWSLGALEAISATFKLKNQVDKLILFNPTSRFTIDLESNYTCGWSEKIIYRMQKNLESETVSTLHSFYKNLFSDKEKQTNAFEYFWNLFAPCNTTLSESCLTAGLQALINLDVRETLIELKLPSLIIHGEKDQICPIEAGRYVNNCLTGSSLKSLESAGHIPFYTNTDKCVQIINTFLGDDNDQ